MPKVTLEVLRYHHKSNGVLVGDLFVTEVTHGIDGALVAESVDSVLTLPRNNKLSEDAESCFFQYKSRQAWRKYFALAKRYRDVTGQLSLVALTGVPMGWTFSMGILQIVQGDFAKLDDAEPGQPCLFYREHGCSRLDEAELVLQAVLR